MPSSDQHADAWLTPKPRSELRHWSQYATVDEWFRDYHGRVPVEAAIGLRRLVAATGMTFPDAYRTLLVRGAIIHIDPADDAEPPDPGPAVPVTGETAAPEGRRESDRKADQAGGHR